MGKLNGFFIVIVKSVIKSIRKIRDDFNKKNCIYFNYYLKELEYQTKLIWKNYNFHFDLFTTVLKPNVLAYKTAHRENVHLIWL